MARSAAPPARRREYLAWLDGLDGRAEVAVIEIPLLYETGGEALFDAVVVVTAPEETRGRGGGEARALRQA